MTFPSNIQNPNKQATPATEIRLKDRLLTNDQISNFFIEIPKRLEIIDLVTVDKMYNSPCIDLGNMKEVIAHINEIDLNDLPKKMLKSLRNRGYI